MVGNSGGKKLENGLGNGTLGWSPATGSNTCRELFTGAVGETGPPLPIVPDIVKTWPFGSAVHDRYLRPAAMPVTCSNESFVGWKTWTPVMPSMWPPTMTTRPSGKAAWPLQNKW